MIGITSCLSLRVFNDVDDAITAGFHNDGKYEKTKSLTITDAVVIRDGTKNGNATVDLILKDDDGNQYVSMITGNLLNTVATASQK